MGILTNATQFLAKKTTAAAIKAADGITAASELSLRQIQEIEDKRQEYLAQKPDMTDTQAQTVIQRNLGAIGIEVYQEYLTQLKKFYCPVNLAAVNYDELNRIRYIDITKLVNLSDEQYIDNLVGVYQVLSGQSCNVALIYHRTKTKCTVTLAVANTDADQSDPAEADAYLKKIVDALKGRFHGIEIRERTGKVFFGNGIPECLQAAIKTNAGKPITKSVASVSNLPSEKSKNSISQSIESLLNGVVPKNDSEAYTLVLLAAPDTSEKKNRLLEIATELSPYETWQTSHTITSSDGQSSSANVGAHLGTHGGANIGKNVVGTTSGLQFNRSSNITTQVAMTQGVGQTATNYNVRDALETAKKQVERLKEGEALGLWDFAAYVISDSYEVADNVAHSYLALTQGEESYLTTAVMHLWNRGEKDALPILESIQKIQHPVFSLKPSLDDAQLMYPTLVTPSVCITGKELVRAMNFPRKSVSGLPVLEGVPFGLEVHRRGNTEKAAREIVMGHLQHLGQTEPTQVTLDVDTLASHVFITGTTNSGKSNTVYQMLDKLREHGVKFLVVEPAKGEYKKVFGGTSHVYGTNPKISDLLCINPFSFPEKISVDEHIDRLIEIFNACWPMYAAMPAILKEAVEQSYERVGWDLANNRCSPRCFPTFADLIDILSQVISSSRYSSDTKSDYEGALVTRVRSMTNGIAGRIFCGKHELSPEELFENDVIIDLSRTSATDTKSLLMGIIVMKLQEYRMHLDRMNEKLLHVTVLEEAHNLLRKTSVDQVQEGANLQGQSVKMLTDSIAEMRTYGEGFIIADQGPCQLDEAVIRNTNTKIVLRLPGQADRQVVGSAMALNEKQITELAKLPKGVVAIYQSDWTETVLCRIDQFPSDKILPLKYTPKGDRDDRPAFELFFKKLFGISDNRELNEEDVDTIENWIDTLRKSPGTKDRLKKVLTGRKLTPEEQQAVAYNVFNGLEIAQLLESEAETSQGIEKANIKIASYLQINNDEITDHVRRLILQVISNEVKDNSWVKHYIDFEDEGRIR